MEIDPYAADCPTRQVLDHVADKWTGLVVGRLEGGTKRFSQLRREVGGVSQKMLTQTLRRLERDGMVVRVVYPEVPPRVEYTLTPLGHSFGEAVAVLRTWTGENFGEVVAAREHYDAARASTQIPPSGEGSPPGGGSRHPVDVR